VSASPIRAEPEGGVPSRTGTTDGIAEPAAPRRTPSRGPRDAPVEDADALMARADQARLGGRPAEAASLLERAMAREGDPAAGVAAFTLGRLELDVLSRPARAASAFTRALALPLPPRLREDAAARLVEAHVAAGDREAARAAAAEYLARYPEGRHAARVRSSAGNE
jgi:transmembrane sensor